MSAFQWVLVGMLSVPAFLIAIWVGFLLAIRTTPQSPPTMKEIADDEAAVDSVRGSLWDQAYIQGGRVRAGDL